MIELLNAMLAYYCASMALLVMIFEHSTKRREAIQKIDAFQERPNTFLFLLTTFFVPLTVLMHLSEIFQPRR